MDHFVIFAATLFKVYENVYLLHNPVQKQLGLDKY